MSHAQRAHADAEQKEDTQSAFLAPILCDFVEPRRIAAELLARSTRSAAVGKFFSLLSAKQPQAIIERTCAWVEHHLVHDAGYLLQGSLCEPAASHPETLTECYECKPHASWANQWPASAGRAYSALCIARTERQLARVRGWLLEGEAGGGAPMMRAWLRQDMGATEQAQLMLQCCAIYSDHVGPVVQTLRDTGQAGLIPHLVSVAAEELAQLRQCRERVEATGWVRSFMRKELDAAEQKLVAVAKLEQ